MESLQLKIERYSEQNRKDFRKINITGNLGALWEHCDVLGNVLDSQTNSPGFDPCWLIDWLSFIREASNIQQYTRVTDQN